jgi:hypothetical protein
VPRLIGESRAAARGAVLAAGLAFAVDPGSADGSSARVTSQSPAPGTRVPSGTTVTVGLGVTRSASPSLSASPTLSASPIQSTSPSESLGPVQPLGIQPKDNNPWLPLVLFVAVLVLGTAVTAVVARTVHRRRQDARSAGRIEAFAQADSDPRLEIRVQDSHLDIAVNLEPHLGITTETTKEVHR